MAKPTPLRWCALQPHAERQPAADGADYTLDHSAGIYLFDARGRWLGVAAYQTPTAQLRADLLTSPGRRAASGPFLNHARPSFDFLAGCRGFARLNPRRHVNTPNGAALPIG